MRKIHGFLHDQRARLGREGEPFDLVISGMSWAECMWDDLERAEPMIRRVDHGPPALAP